MIGFCEKILSNTSLYSEKLQSTFVKLKAIINSDCNKKEKKTAWRQQAFVLHCMDGKFSNVLMENLWTDYSVLVNVNFESDTLNTFVENDDIGCNLLFPTVNDADYPPNQDESIEMFNLRSSEMKEHKNKKLDKAKSRNTLENFLQHKSSFKDIEPLSFFSARQLLDVQELKKTAQIKNSILNEQSLESGKQPRADISFNFGATKKSLGSLGRVYNYNRMNFVPPVKTKSLDEEPTDKTMDPKLETLTSHPALKNVDSKMAELISNEIIQKFKPVDWNEIAGLDYAKSIIKEAVVYPLLRPDIFTGLRRPPKGILLFGPPGTGKTLIGKCIASQSSSTFFSISSSSLTSKWMGDGEKMVRTLFAVAIVRQPSVIFIDEVDSLLSQRSENENEGTRRLKTEFLIRLDGAATSDEDRVLIVGATNRPQELDEAVRRRFVKRLYVPLPEVDARAEIVKNLLKTVENNLSLNEIKEISQLTEGYSGSDMDSLCREASMEPLRSLPAEDILNFHKECLRPVNMEDFYIALKKIRPSVSQTDLSQYVEWNKTYGSSC